MLRHVFVEQVQGQWLDVLQPLAQRRDADGVDVEPVEQILAKAPFAHRLRQIGVGRRDDAHVHLARRCTAQAVDLAALQHAQQLGLRGQGQLAELVEHQRAAVRTFEAPYARGGGAGVGTLLRTEKLAFDQLGWQCRAVDRDEGFVGARAHRMQRPREALLAHAGLACEQHRHLRLCCLAQQLDGLYEGG